MDGWNEVLSAVDEDVRAESGEEARELGRGLLRLLAERRARTGEDPRALLVHALGVLECATWYLADALDAVDEGAELADLRGRA